jgi:hypothetical protein
MSVAKGLRAGLLPAVLGGCVCLGCAHPHFVSKNADGGVIALPRDTPMMHAKADRMMRKQFPDGFVIDNEQVVAVGSPYETRTRMGPMVKVETHQEHEIYITYHSIHAHPPAPVPVPGAPGPAAVATAAPAPQAPPPVAQLPGGLPSQPVPYHGN